MLRNYQCAVEVVDGKLVLMDKPAFNTAMWRMKPGRKVLKVEEPPSKRTLDMNAYLHCANGPFRLLAEHFGEDMAGVKYALMGECFGWIYSAAAGREIPVKAHTSEMTREESKYFVDWVIPWAALNHGVLIALPDEAL